MERIMKDRRTAERLQLDLLRETAQYLQTGGEAPGGELWAEVQKLRRERMSTLGVVCENRIWPAARRDASNRVWSVTTREQSLQIVRKRIWLQQKYRLNGRRRLQTKQCVRLNGINGEEQEKEYAVGAMLLPDYIAPYRMLLARSGILFAIIALAAIGIGFGAYGGQGAQAGLLFTVTAGVIAAGAVFVISSVICALVRGMKSTRYEMKKSLFEKGAKDWNPDFVYEQFLLEALLKFERWMYKNPEYERICDVRIAEVITETWNSEKESAGIRIRAEWTEVVSVKKAVRKKEEYDVTYAAAPSEWPEKRGILDRWQMTACERRTENHDRKDRTGNE